MTTSRRAFIAAVTAGVAALSVACAGMSSAAERGDDDGAGPDGAAAARLDPAGGGGYPSVGPGDPCLAVPGDDDLDGFEPLVLEEDGGVRVASPFFSVFVPDGMFPDGFDVEFSPDMPEGEWGDGLLRGYDLVVVETGGGANVSACVASANWLGVQGSGIAVSAGPVASDQTFHVVVSGPCDRAGDPVGEQALRDLYPTYELVSPYIAAARGGDGSWTPVEVSRELPEVLDGDGGAVLSTPWYSVHADPSVWPDGLLYRYYGEEVPVGDGQGSRSGFLALFGPDGPELSCLLYVCDGPWDEVSSLDGAGCFAVREVGAAADGSGRSVALAVPVRGVTRDNFDRLDELRDASGSELEMYAGCVAL